MYYQLLSAAERDAIIQSHLREWLGPLGLNEIIPRRWVDGSQPPARRIFELQLLKGAGLGALWGFSLDFVPHISGGSLRWHRSDKTAMADAVIIQTDLPQPDYIHGPDNLIQGLRSLLPLAIARAKDSWRRGATLPGMLELVREIRDGRPNHFPYDNLTQMPLAYAFLSAKTGDLQVAESELDRYVSEPVHGIDPDVAARLKKLARDYAASSI